MFTAAKTKSIDFYYAKCSECNRVYNKSEFKKIRSVEWDYLSNCHNVFHICNCESVHFVDTEGHEIEYW